MTNKERYEKAVRLCEGGVVEVASLYVKAVIVEGDIHACDVCDMDCICRDEMQQLCIQCDDYDRKRHYLKLVNP